MGLENRDDLLWRVFSRGVDGDLDLGGVVGVVADDVRAAACHSDEFETPFRAFERADRGRAFTVVAAYGTRERD